MESRKRRDQRAGPRVAITVPVDIFLGDRDEPIRARSLDLGMGGVCVQTEKSFPAEAACAVALELSAGSLRLEARGVWQRDTVIEKTVLTGFQFAEPSVDAGRTIWKVLQRRVEELTRFIIEASDLQPIDVDEAMDLTLRTRRRYFPGGSYIYQQDTLDQTEESAFIVAHGQVSLEGRKHQGELFELDRISEGSVFGGLPIVMDLAHVDSAMAVSDVQVLEIDRYSYRELVREKPLVARGLDRAVIQRCIAHLRKAFS